MSRRNKHRPNPDDSFVPIDGCPQRETCPLTDDNCGCLTPPPPPPPLEPCVDCTIHRSLHEREARRREVEAELMRQLIAESDARLTEGAIKAFVARMAALQSAQRGESADTTNNRIDSDGRFNDFG